MSAIMCGDIAIARVANYVYDHMMTGYRPIEPKDLTAACITMESDEFRVHIFRELFAMNVYSLQERYKHHINEYVAPEEAEILQILNKPSAQNKFQTLKTMDCYMYQCSNGNVRDMELFKYISLLSLSLGHEIARKTPEYISADWK